MQHDVIGVHDFMGVLLRAKWQMVCLSIVMVEESLSSNVAEGDSWGQVLVQEDVDRNSSGA